MCLTRFLIPGPTPRKRPPPVCIATPTEANPIPIPTQFSSPLTHAICHLSPPSHSPLLLYSTHSIHLSGKTKPRLAYTSKVLLTRSSSCPVFSPPLDETGPVRLIASRDTARGECGVHRIHHWVGIWTDLTRLLVTATRPRKRDRERKRHRNVRGAIYHPKLLFCHPPAPVESKGERQPTKKNRSQPTIPFDITHLTSDHSIIVL